MKVKHVPPMSNAPRNGGVKEHIRHLQNALKGLGVESVESPIEADLIHLQTSYTWDGRIDIWTCHGGFVPPIPAVMDNMHKAHSIISVAAWLIERHFPKEYWPKTAVIPNGIDLSEWESLLPSGIEPGFVLWGKGFYRPDWLDFYKLAQEFAEHHFVSTIVPPKVDILPNLEQIGLFERQKMHRVINDCTVYVSTGSEVCPTTILEAWACSKPVLAWDGDGNKELLKNGGGILYSDVNSMIAGLQECIENAAEFGAQGRRLVKQRYNWQELGQRTLEVYQRCF